MTSERKQSTERFLIIKPSCPTFPLPPLSSTVPSPWLCCSLYPSVDCEEFCDLIKAISLSSLLSLSPFLLSKTTTLLHFHSFPRRPLCGCLAKVKLQFQLYWKLIIIQVLTHLSPPTMCVASGHFICSYYKHSSVIRYLFQSHPQSNRCASLLFLILPPTRSTHSSSYLKFH